MWAVKALLRLCDLAGSTEPSLTACTISTKFQKYAATYMLHPLRKQYSKTCFKRPHKKKTTIGFQDQLSLNASSIYT